MKIQINKTITNLHRITSSQKDHTLLKKNELQHKHGQNNTSSRDYDVRRLLTSC